MSVLLIMPTSPRSSAGSPQSPEIRQLKELASHPAAQAAYAASLVHPDCQRLALRAALEVLAQTPVPDARSAILAVYEHLAANGPKRDPGAFMRKAALDALRPVVMAEDVPLLVQAVATYEFLPPDFKEEASLLRSSGLVALNEVDDALAAYHAARLLVDEHTEEMSGEPAITAVRVLASQEQWLLLYQAVMLPRGTILADAVGACLQNQTAIPTVLLPGIVERCRSSTDPTVLLGLFDLLIGHKAGPQAPEFLEEMLSSLQDPDLYRYLMVTLLSAHNEKLDDLVVNGIRFETDQAKLAVILEVLEIFDLGHDGKALKKRLSGRANALDMPRQPSRSVSP